MLLQTVTAETLVTGLAVLHVPLPIPEVESRTQGQGHKKNPRPRTALPRTDPFKAKDTCGSVLQKKKVHKKFFQTIYKISTIQNQYNSKKISKSAGIPNKVKQFMNASTLLQLYCSIFHSCLQYGIISLYGAQHLNLI